MADSAVFRSGNLFQVQEDDVTVVPQTLIVNFEGPSVTVTNEGAGKATVAISAGSQNLWETIQSDSGSTSADSMTDTLTISGGTGISTSISGDVLTITNDSPNVDQNLFETINADTGSLTATSTTDTVTVAGGTGISTSISGDTITITNDSPNVDQNLWETFSSDSGSVSANTIDDTFSIVGGTGISTSISGDTLTITNDSPNVDQDVWATFNADSGSATANSSNDTFTFTGGTGISTSISGDIVTITNDITSIDDLTDVDTTSEAPIADDILYYDGSGWVPGVDVPGLAVAEVTQTSHGFSQGDVVYLDAADDTWKLAQSDDEDTVGVGMVNAVNANNFKVVLSGFIDGLSALSPGEYYFVSDTIAGGITATEPSRPSISRPILHALTANTGFVLPFRGSTLATVLQEQNIWATVQGDSGTTTANVPADILTVAGGQNIDTSVSGDTLTIDAPTVLIQGKHTLWQPAGSMLGKITGGPSFSTNEVGASQVLVSTYNFDAAVNEAVQFTIGMPESWDEGTLTFQIHWAHSAAGSGNVVWTVRALGIGDGDSIDGTFGSNVSVTDAGGTVDTQYVTAETSPMTVGNTPAAGDMVVFEVARNAVNASDTLGVDARLIGIKIFYTVDAGNDA